jgi:hypothetical protein
MTKPDGMSSTCLLGTTDYENWSRLTEPRTYVVVGLNGAKSPWMSLTLDAFENNGLSLSLRRGAREGDFRYSCILTSCDRGESYGSLVLAVLRTGCS